MRTTPPSNIKGTSISLEKPLLEKARKLAKLRRQSFSSYVATLLDADIRKQEAA